MQHTPIPPAADQVELHSPDVMAFWVMRLMQMKLIVFYIGNTLEEQAGYAEKNIIGNVGHDTSDRVQDILGNHATCAGVAPIDGLVLDTVGYMNDRTKSSDIRSH